VSAESPPLRGEVWLVSFDPSVGGKIRKTRPAVVLSNDTANAVLNRIQVVPVSSQVDLYPAEAGILLNGERRKAMADQISTVSKRRLQRRLGALGKEDLDAVLRAVRLQLGL
jgi:mRNA interferase MazF